MENNFGTRFIYADNAATTNITDDVLNAMLPYLKENYGNPSGLYSLARKARKAVEESRTKTAAAIGASPREIFFTSGGTESDNWAIKSAVLAASSAEKKHIVTTAIEHHAVLNTCKYLEKLGFEVTYLPVSENGIIDPAQVENAVRSDTAVVSVMYANNEIGTIQPITEIGAVCRRKNVLFHTDAVQAVGNVPINVGEQNIDMLSVSGHKIHAQKGIGFLYVRTGTELSPFMHGGAQERGRRAGTHNVPAIVGLGRAMELACENITERAAALAVKRDRLADGLLKIPASRLNGDRINRLKGNVNVSFLGTEGEALVAMLDMKGICVSSGSACASDSADPSHVLLALGLPRDAAAGSLRFTLADDISDDDIDYMIETVKNTVGMIRESSPYWQEIVNDRPGFNELRKYFSDIH